MSGRSWLHTRFAPAGGVGGLAASCALTKPPPRQAVKQSEAQAALQREQVAKQHLFRESLDLQVKERKLLEEQAKKQVLKDKRDLGECWLELPPCPAPAYSCVVHRDANRA